MGYRLDDERDFGNPSDSEYASDDGDETQTERKATAKDVRELRAEISAERV